MKRWILFALLAASIYIPRSAPAQDSSDRYVIHVLTLGKAEDLFTRFGHIALVVQDRDRRSWAIYNFGTFNFNDPNLRFEYLKGNLIFWLSVRPFFPGDLREFRYFDRTATLRTLDLPQAVASEIAHKLRINSFPENRKYQYLHYVDNCCTRVRDILDNALDGLLSRGKKDKPTGNTYRYWTRKCTEGMPLMGTLIDYALGPAVDRPITRWEEYFLPEEFSKDLDLVRQDNGTRPLVSRKRFLYKRRADAPADSIPYYEWVPVAVVVFLWLLGFGCALILGAGKWGRRALGLGISVWGLLAGIGGLALAVMWIFTSHTDTYANENLLLTPITHLWILLPGLKLLAKGTLGRSSRWVWWYVLASLGLVILDVLMKLVLFHQDNWRFILLALVLDLLVLGGMYRTGLWSPKSVKRI